MRDQGIKMNNFAQTEIDPKVRIKRSKSRLLIPVKLIPAHPSEGSTAGIKNTPLYYVDKRLALILDPYPPVRCYRVITGRMSTGFVPHPDSHPRVPYRYATPRATVHH